MKMNSEYNTQKTSLEDQEAALLARYPAKPARVVGAVEADAPWRLVKVRPAAEFKVAEGLGLYDLPVYAPVERVWRPTVHGPAKPHDRPLIRGYVFARLGAMGHLLHDIDGAVGLVVIGGELATVPPALVAKLQARQAEGEFDETRKPEARPRPARRRAIPRVVGERVTVAAEPFDGFVGTVVKLKGERRVQVLLDMLGAAGRPVTVELADLDGIEAATPAAA